jgi:selenocysteine lyase/cysteine desulfurase
LDELRRSDFSRLDDAGHHYFDYTGAGLPAQRQLDAIRDLLSQQVLGNPHSQNPTSAPATALVEEARSRVLDYFGATDHECIFTANASGALKLVGEAFPFDVDRPFLLTADNHNSVNGIREFARRAGAPVAVAPLELPGLSVRPEVLTGLLEQPAGERSGLFAYPAQSNYSGLQHPLSWVADARTRGWRVLLDTAAFVPTNRLDLSVVQADFVCVSFYKMFGLPTGVGALIARRDALAELRRPWFAGGTISMASVAADDHRLTPGHAGFEDGTSNFGSIPAVTFGLELIETMGIDSIHDRVVAATSHLLRSFDEMSHANGEPVVKVLGGVGNTPRGGTITFNVFDPGGVMVHDRVVTGAASKVGISLRSGCFCNPGCGEAARGLTAGDIAPLFQRDVVPDFCDLDDRMWTLRGSGASALRASVGWVTNGADLSVLIEFLAGFIDRPATSWVAPEPGSRATSPDAP